LNDCAASHINNLLPSTLDLWYGIEFASSARLSAKSMTISSVKMEFFKGYEVSTVFSIAEPKRASFEKKQADYSSKSKELELAYEYAVRKVDSTCFKESARQLRLRVLLLEDENDDLHDQLAQEDERMDQLEKSTEELQETITSLESEAKRTQGILRLKTREVENMQVSHLESS
jgi:predicted RNase H-like nuclease (RuvC/YqgF family)